MRRSVLAILVQPFWCFLPSTNNLNNYASDQEIVLCSSNPGDPGDCIFIRILMPAPNVLRFLWPIFPILGSQGNNIFAVKCTVKQSMLVLSAFTLKNSPFCHRSNHILESQRSSLIQHITARGGDWPPTNGELVAKYLNAFSRFIEPIDFQKLN
jgi:hypothetical protein